MSVIKHRLTLAVIAIFAITALAACGPVSTASPPTPTPQEQNTAPTATPTPEVPAPIVIDPQTNPGAFLSALPSAQVDCAASAVGGIEALGRVVSMQEDGSGSVSKTQLQIMASCFSDATVQQVILGQLELRTGGLSDESSACAAEVSGSINLAGMFASETIDAESFVGLTQALFCLDDDERASLEASGSLMVDFSDFGGIDALECAADGAGTTDLDELASYFSSSDASLEAIADLVPVLTQCGVIEEEQLTETGFSSEEFSCLLSQLDQDALDSLMTFTEDPNSSLDFEQLATVLDAMDPCGIQLDQLMEAAGEAGIVDDGNGTETGGTDATPVPVISTDLLFCLTDNGVTADLAASYAAGLADAETNATLAAALEICLGGPDGEATPVNGLVIPDGEGGTTVVDASALASLPLTLEQMQCLVDTIGYDQLQGVAEGTVSPITILGALGTCDITITQLLGG